jgi:hypothetical protein
MKKIAVTKILAVSLFLFLVGTLSSSPADAAWAGNIVDNFDAASINTHLWQPFEESTQTHLVQQGGELRITIDGGSIDHGAGVSSKFLLKGNFVMTVDYRLIAWPGENGVRLGFEGGGNSNSDSDPGVMVKRISLGPDEQPPSPPYEVYSADFFDGSTWYGFRQPATDTAGQGGSLRLDRVGSVLYAYYSTQPNNWILIGSHDYGGTLEEWVGMTIWAIGNPPAGQNVEIAFDNFQVFYDQVRLSSDPSPLNLLLLE